MRTLLVTAGLLAALAATAPARADFAVVRYGDGHCQIWWDSTTDPWGANWSKIAMGLPDHAAALAVLDNAVAQSVCR